MIAIICVDDNMGMLFNHRRQSRDSILVKRILEIAAGHLLWMNNYSGKLFDNWSDRIIVDDGFLSKAGADDYVFVETESLNSYIDRIDQIVLFRWNRVYPYDMKLDIDLNLWHLESTRDFAGSSHERITEEVFKKNDGGLLV